MSSHSHNKTILIADHSVSNLSFWGKQLKKAGYNILTALDGKQAIEIAQNKVPDAVIIEKNIPQIDGFVVHRILKSYDTTHHIHVIILAEDQELSETEAGFGVSDECIVLKPVHLSELIARVGTLLAEGIDGQHTPVVMKQDSSSGVILMIEDNELNQIYMSSLITEMGYRVDIARDGGEALLKFRNGNYDMVLTDINVPVINGIEFTNMIRQTDRSQVPVIAVTGHDDKEMVEKCRAAGVNSYLVKPFQARQLTDLIKREMATTSASTTSDLNLSVATSNQQAGRSYDYSQAVSLANGDQQLFDKWLGRFMGLVRTAQEFVNQSIEIHDFTRRNKVFHELINYSGYFGVDDLRLYIKELQSIQKFSMDNKRLENFYKKIKRELDDIEVFFSNQKS